MESAPDEMMSKMLDSLLVDEAFIIRAGLNASEYTLKEVLEAMFQDGRTDADLSVYTGKTHDCGIYLGSTSLGVAIVVEFVSGQGARQGEMFFQVNAIIPERFPENRCPGCSESLARAFNAAGEEGAPEVGDCIMGGGCLFLLQVMDTGRLRVVPEREWDIMPEGLRDLIEHVRGRLQMETAS